MKNFCILPFIHLYINNRGKANLCCVSRNSFNNDYNILDKSVEEIWNSDYMKNIRMQFLKGEKIPECEGCWKVEEQSTETLTIRKYSIDTFLNTNHSSYKETILRVKEAKDNNGYVSLYPSYIGWDALNTCNLRCIMCNSEYSTAWEKEIKIHGPYKELINPKNTIIDNSILLCKIKKFTPYIRQLYVAGGEPLLTKEVLDLLKYCVVNGYSRQIMFSCNTNGTVANKKLIELIKCFKQVHFNISLDGYGKINEWIRYPSKWNRIEDNIFFYMKNLLKSASSISITPTLTAYTIFYLDRLYSWRNSNLKEFIKLGYRLPIYPSMLQSPTILRPSLLPKKLKIEFAKKMKIVETINKNEKDHLNGIIESIMQTESNEKYLLNKLRSYTKELDRRRNLDSKKIFPELTFLYE